MQRADSHVGAQLAQTRERVEPARPREVEHQRIALERRRDRGRCRFDRAVGSRDHDDLGAAPDLRHQDRFGRQARRRGGRRRGIGRATRDGDHTMALFHQRQRDRGAGAPRPDERDGTGARTSCSGIHARSPRGWPQPSAGDRNVTAVSRTSFHSAFGSTRSGATSRSGASTKPRSHMRGCGMTSSSSSSCRSS